MHLPMDIIFIVAFVLVLEERVENGNANEA
jgi:hypothetical protein